MELTNLRHQVAPRPLAATAGVFDLLHDGHRHLLRTMHESGAFVVVLINSDNSVRRIKGPSRPVQPEAVRAFRVWTTTYADMVLTFSDDEPCYVLNALRPQYYYKGGDYTIDQLPEAEFCDEVVIVPRVPGISTTQILKKSCHRKNEFL